MNTDSVTSSCEGTLSPQKQHSYCDSSLVIESGKSGRRDLNPRPLEPHSSALPSCATARFVANCPLIATKAPELKVYRSRLTEIEHTIRIKWPGSDIGICCRGDRTTKLCYGPLKRIL